jgi:Tfp pilus assembly protein FimV
MGSFSYTIRSGDTLWMLAQRYQTTVNAIVATNPGVDLRTLRIGQVICIPYPYVINQPNPNPARPDISRRELNFQNHIRMLWSQHIFWTRLVIESIVFGLPDEEVATNRLLRNPEDFAAALRPFYGDRIASRFAALFRSHLVIAGELVKAVKAADTKAAADAEKRWYANADEIAAFLASINPNWNEREWRNMLHEHLDLTKSEAVNLLTNNYAESIAILDQIEKQAMDMATVMVNGIVRQFPSRF